jgi:hypothetical protein
LTTVTQKRGSVKGVRRSFSEDPGEEGKLTPRPSDYLASLGNQSLYFYLRWIIRIIHIERVFVKGTVGLISSSAGKETVPRPKFGLGCFYYP